jgi:hypothetical protein
MLAAEHLCIAEYLAACSEKDRKERETRERLDRYELAAIAGETRREMRLRQVDVGKVNNPAGAGEGARIFISASRKDLAVSEKIGAVLTSSGYNLTSDFQDILPGEEWAKRIADIVGPRIKCLF